MPCDSKSDCVLCPRKRRLFILAQSFWKMATSTDDKFEGVEGARSKVSVGFKEITNVHGTYSAHAFRSIGRDNSFRLDDFISRFGSRVLSDEGDTMVFELWGLDPPIANAIRRILLAEVPTVAIETVRVHDNSSIVPDEMLSHRLGLVPLQVDPRRMEIRTNKDEPLTARNCIKFSLKTRCDKNPSAPRDGIAATNTLYIGSQVLSGSIKYVPYPGANQISDLALDAAPKPVHDDIVIAKMRPGQRIHVELDAVKGVGKDHAKFSPVATASYRMLPEIRLKRAVTGPRARELVNICPMQVFDIEDGNTATVARPRDCTMCRECIRDPSWNDDIELSRRRDHFIYSVESTGALPARVLVSEALTILIEKCRSVQKCLQDVLRAQNLAAESIELMEQDETAEGDSEHEQEMDVENHVADS